MALADGIAAAISAGERLVAEAGTGSGKTLAYLHPAIASGLKTVVSTGTKNLQEQLVNKDVPLLARALGREIDVQVMKGRTNYLCHVRAERFAGEPLFPSLDEARAYAAVERWRHRTRTGDRAELSLLTDDSALWRELTATSDQCLGRKCRDYERCFVTLMRQRAQLADLVVVNHHLYLADLALRQRLGEEAVFLLPAHDLVVFDEAHDLDEVAANHFGVAVSERRFVELVHDVERLVAGDAALAGYLRPRLSELSARARRLFEALPFGVGRTSLEALADRRALAEAYVSLDEQLEQLEGELALPLEEAAPLARRAQSLAAELCFVLGTKARRELPRGPDLALDGARDAVVRYTELAGRTRTAWARPVDVSRLLREALGGTRAVFLSATLRVDGSFSHFRARVGLDRTRELAVGSPFDYRTAARFYVADDLPEPDRPEFAPLAAARAAELVNASGGGAFVLATSHRMLTILRGALESATSLRILMQGEAPRSHLVETFRADGNAALVATMSFWQGVDVPGSALRLVILDKLPFASPGDPVTAARLELLGARGGDPFMDYQVPQAALLLRQGFGRLIRRHSDRGLVALLDRRVLHRRYGAVFLRSLPDCPRLTALADALDFLRAGRDGLSPAPAPAPQASAPARRRRRRGQAKVNR